eukprot:284819785_6
MQGLVVFLLFPSCFPRPLAEAWNRFTSFFTRTVLPRSHIPFCMSRSTALFSRIPPLPPLRCYTSTFLRNKILTNPYTEAYGYSLILFRLLLLCFASQEDFLLFYYSIADHSVDFYDNQLLFLFLYHSVKPLLGSTLFLAHASASSALSYQGGEIQASFFRWKTQGLSTLCSSNTLASLILGNALFRIFSSYFCLYECSRISSSVGISLLDFTIDIRSFGASAIKIVGMPSVTPPGYSPGSCCSRQVVH